MPKEAYYAIIILTPFLGTTLGALCVYFIKKQLPPRLEKFLLGFAAGVMISASFFSLLLPSIEESAELGNLAFLPPLTGFALGIGFMFLLDSLLPHLHPKEDAPEGLPSRASKAVKLTLAMTLHNIPEGLSAGVSLAAAASGQTSISIMSALLLAIGIAVQNFPEGAVVSLPLAEEGKGKTKAFFLGSMSGIVEPIAALIALSMAGIIAPALPYLLAFAAGAMVYVSVEELIPDAQKGEHSNMPTVGFAIGFALLMLLSITLG